MRHHPVFSDPRDVSAFAEGRRLRQQSERRRGEMRRRAHRHHARHHPHDHRLDHRRRRAGAAAPLLILLAVPAAIGAGLALAALVTALGLLGVAVVLHLGPPLLAGWVTYAVVRRHVRRNRLRRGGAAGTAPLPGRPVAPPRPDRVWQHARSRFHRLRAEYAAYECNAMWVLRLPALADVTVPSTARFVDAFAEAQALETDAYPGAEHGPKFVAAVDRAERAWKAAKDAAERIRLTGLDPAERSTVERIIKLLTTARDTDNEPERLAAYTRARAELAKLDQAGLVHVPLPAQAALDAAARGQLPAAEAVGFGR